MKQQNLVYVIGLVPTLKDEQKLLETLRGGNYFGQYGDIEKIVVSKPKPGAVNQGIGVYVTFARKEDAAVCISMVDGSQNGDRVLRAQYGTTKYCSAYLRGENCNNKNCTFLHESGEDGQNTSIQNEPSGKRPGAVSQTSFAHTSTRPIGTSAINQPPRSQVKDDPVRKDSTDASALPTTASWAKPEAQQAFRTRRESQTASRSSPSPQILNVKPATTAQIEGKRKDTATPPVQAAKPAIPATKSSKSQSSSGRSSPRSQKAKALFDDVFASVNSPDFRFVFDESSFSKEELTAIYRLPTLIDPFGGAKRRLMREKEASEHAKLEAEAQLKLQATANSTIDAIEDEQLASGSLQLGGEPEDPSHAQRGDTRAAIGRPSSQLQANNVMNDQFSNLSIEGRSLTPHQRQQLALLSSGNTQPAPGLGQPSQTAFSDVGFDSADQRSNLFANQPVTYDGTSGHARQSSRYSFANDTSKGTSNTRYGQQQGVSAQQQHFYPSGVQGPPPGLKTAGTPPISGGGMFAQGHGFTSNMNTSFGANKGSDADVFLRGRSGTGSGHDGKREFSPYKSFFSSPSTSPAPNLLNIFDASMAGLYQDHGYSRQKKRGKKHRHANTSSAGGGVVDLADPSILQARIHQGGGGAGQGAFGGQGQGGYNNQSNMMYGGGGYGRW